MAAPGAALPAARFRHERKHYITPADHAALCQRLAPVMERDPHAGPDGTYTVHSLYFDDWRDTALREKGLPDPACDAEFHLAAAEALDNPTLYQRFFTQRQGLLDAAQALGAAEPAALIERNRAIAEAFTVGKDTAPHIRRYYDDLTEQTAKELVV